MQLVHRQFSVSTTGSRVNYSHRFGASGSSVFYHRQSYSLRSLGEIETRSDRLG